jgi:hypothetical protein
MCCILSKNEDVRLVAIPAFTAEDAARIESAGLRRTKGWLLKITAMSPDVFFALQPHVSGVSQFTRQNDDGSVTISVLFHCGSDPVIIVSDRSDVVVKLIRGLAHKESRKQRKR